MAETLRADSEVDRDWLLLFAAWLVAAAAGSLYFRLVLELPPCVLCWYQRIALFPLVVVLARGLFPLDRGVVRYALPLAGIGWLVAAYHNLVHAGVVPERLTPCAKGLSCSERNLELFGFVSIPVVAVAAPATLAVRRPRGGAAIALSPLSTAGPRKAGLRAPARIRAS